MRTLRITALLAIVLMAFACGSATEVGNPTGTVPTRTVTGVVDTSSFDDGAAAAMSLDAENAVSPTEFSVVAVASDDVAEAPVEEDSSFTIQVRIRTTYEWEVRLGGIRVGDFSFEQGDGSRGNALRIENMGSDIYLGTVRYQDGSFIPEFEPARQDGGYWQPGSGDGGGGSSGSGGGNQPDGAGQGGANAT